MTDARPAAVVVLAAGEGTRMKSSTPKVLHGFAGRTLVGHVLAACAPLGADTTVVVVGHAREQVAAHLAEVAPAATPVVQEEQRGTGHALRVALDAVPTVDGTVLVVPGDAPLLTAEILAELVGEHQSSGAVATLLTTVLPDPTGFGRILRGTAGEVRRIVEERDAGPAEKVVGEVGTSVYAFESGPLRAELTRLSTDNAQGEEYLTDVVEAFVAAELPVFAVTMPAVGPVGVNDKVQLAESARVFNDRLLERWMRAGVVVQDPATTWLDADVRLEPDAVLRPGVQLLGATTVAAGAEIGPDCTLTNTTVGPDAKVVRTHADGAEIGPAASVGPWSYLRPGAKLGRGAKVGAYVEVKASEIGAGSKVPHLSYVGDAVIGEQTNIGAATVVVNYDGTSKHRTTVGDHVRIGSDTMLVAPVTVGDGAYTAAGSVITEDVPAGALAVARGRQRNVDGWVARRRPGTPAAEAAGRSTGSGSDGSEG